MGGGLSLKGLKNIYKRSEKTLISKFWKPKYKYFNIGDLNVDLLNFNSRKHYFLMFQSYG